MIVVIAVLCFLWLEPDSALQAQALSSKRCGINVAPKISAAVPEARAAPVCMAIEAKLKTRKAMSKRYKVTSTGKVMRRHAGKQHSNEKKAHKRLKRLSKEESVFIGDVCFSFLLPEARTPHYTVELHLLPTVHAAMSLMCDSGVCTDCVRCCTVLGNSQSTLDNGSWESGDGLMSGSMMAW